MKNLQNLKEAFVRRHIGPNKAAITTMLQAIDASSIEQLVAETIPKNIRTKQALNLPAAQSEASFLKNFQQLMGQNKVFRSFIGMGYHDCLTPTVIQRNILENPAWYTAYTPYQAEIAQGRMEALINFQTMVTDLTGMELANASLLDEGTAAAEAMTLFYRVKAKTKKQAYKFFVEANTFPQTIDLIQGRAKPLGIEVIVGERNTLNVADPDLFGIFLQYPDSNGAVLDASAIIEAAQEQAVKTVVCADLLSLVLLKAPGEMGADAVVGTSQRFGIPLGYGGPHAAYFATKKAYRRQIPGRIIGITEDKHGDLAYRMALQTREQHIRREKATSNICTAQVLLAVMAGMYAVYHGQEGLTRIATKIHLLTTTLAKGLETQGYHQVNKAYFDTLKVEVTDQKIIQKLALKKGINFRYFKDNFIGISLNETTTVEDVQDILYIFASAKQVAVANVPTNKLTTILPSSLQRNTPFLEHPVFNQYHTDCLLYTSPSPRDRG